ncbi:MAG: hypothetical protein P8X74_14015 [Reinekea sp.]
MFSINNQRFECPVDLRNQKIQVRFDCTRRDRFDVYFNDKRMGEAMLLNLHQNAKMHRVTTTDKTTSAGAPL